MSKFKRWLLPVAAICLLLTVLIGGSCAPQSLGEIFDPSGNPFAHRFSDVTDIRAATFVIAALDSEHKFEADYTCDGTSATGGDQVEINTAINALMSSVTDEVFDSDTLDNWVSLDNGKIQEDMVVTSMDGLTTYDRDVDYLMDCSSGLIECLSTGAMLADTDYLIDYDYGGGVISGTGDGTFWVDDSIILLSHVELRNMTIKVIDGINANLDVIVNAHPDFWYIGDDHITVKDLRLDGNKDNRVGGTQRGIYFKRVGYGLTFGCLIQGVIPENFQGDGIKIETCQNALITNNVCKRDATGISVATSSNCIVTKNKCDENTSSGINLTNADNNTVVGNICQDNACRGIYITSSDLNTIVGNVCQNSGGAYNGIDLSNSHSNTITGNDSCNNGGAGIALATSDDNTITGNITIDNAGCGIMVNSSDGNIVSSNVVKGSMYDGISLADADNNVISSNISSENSQILDAAGAGICLSDSDYNLITGNLCRRGVGANQHGYGIDIFDATCDFNMVEGNNLYLSGRTGDLNDAGTNTRVRDNLDNAGAWLADV